MYLLFFPQGAHNGFKFTVHAPDEIPLTENRFFRLDNMIAAFINVSPEVFRATETLRLLNPVKRKCYFANERALQFFRHYNRWNCIVECIANHTLEKCGCVRFSMPRLPGTKICDASRIDCYQRATVQLYEIVVRARLTGKWMQYCHCLPACTSVDYTIEYTQIPINRFPFKLDFKRDKYLTPLLISYNIYMIYLIFSADSGVMFVSFKDRHYLPLWRREFMGTNQAIAQLGGLFALLMGSSMLSIAEVVYYICIRRLRRELP